MSLYVPQAPTILPATAPEGTHDCRLNYISTTQLRLDRFGGNRLMCNGVREVIPAGGVVLNAPVVASSVAYVWCGPSGGIAGAALYLAYDSPEPVIDAFGMPVHPTFRYLTLVGRAYSDGSGNFQMTGNTIGVISYWNRRWLSIAAAVSFSSGNASGLLELHGGMRLNAIGFGGDFIRCLMEGSCLNDSANYTYTAIGQGGGGQLSQLGQHFATVPNAYGMISCHYDYLYPAGGGVFIMTLMGYVNAGIGTWYPQSTMLVWG